MDRDARRVAHLHVHTVFSLGAALSRIPALVERARRQGFGALALTDSGNLSGALEFARAARSVGIRPIIGCEVEVAPPGAPRRRAATGLRPAGSPLVLLARNASGYRNLVWLVSQSHLQSGGVAPQIRREWLLQRGHGLIALSGGRQGELGRAALTDDPERMEQAVAFLVAAFGRDGFFVQIERHGARDERESEARLLSLARKHRLRTVATCDVRYVDRTERPAFECLCSLRTAETGSPPMDPGLMTGASHLRPTSELRRLFNDLPEALDNTGLIAERCDLDLLETARDRWCGNAQQSAPDPALARSVAQGLRRVYQVEIRSSRGGRLHGPARPPGASGSGAAASASITAIVTRANAELEAVRSAGLTRVFTALARVGRAFRRRDLPCVLRDAGNGSLLAHALGLTVIDPLRHGLAWEPWLASLTAQGLAVGIEVPDDQREEAVALLRKTLSTNCVGDVTTFRHLHPRTLCEHLVRWANLAGPARAHWIRALQDSLSRQRRHRSGYRDFEAGMLVAANGEGPALDLPGRRRLKQLIRIAWVLRDLPWLPDEQAATLLVGTGPLIERTPLTLGPGGGVTVQFGLPAVDALGFLKVHVLGWEPLRLLRDAVRGVQSAEDPRVSPPSVPPDDEWVISAILRNQPAATPDLLYPGERELALRLGTRTLEDLALAFALHSPLQAIADTLIARRQGLESSDPPHALLADLVRETHGVLVFQEQALLAIQRLTGWSAEEAAGWHHPTAHPPPGFPGEAAFTAACWEQHRLPRTAAKALFHELQVPRRWRAQTVGKAQLLAALAANSSGPRVMQRQSFGAAESRRPFTDRHSRLNPVPDCSSRVWSCSG